MCAMAAGSEVEGVAANPERIGELERLGRGRERVRHGHVYARGPVGLGTGALPATDRLVIGEAVVPERDVVHRALALSGYGHGLSEADKKEVGDPARGLDVAGRDRGGRARVQDRALGCRDRDGSEGAARGGDVRVGDAADDEVGGRARDGERAVEVSLVLRGCAREVDLDLLAGDGNGCAQLEIALGRLERVASLEASIRKPGDGRAYAPFRVRVQLIHGGKHALAPAAGTEL